MTFESDSKLWLIEAYVHAFDTGLALSSICIPSSVRGLGR
jgi:hypothetical protein